ncbi:MAG TPA: nucleotide exchange factor GrpE [Candidatus Paceibacterota bacterium]|nr:nucleotide exchange factor GrpE [Candidatus Paceibacterota bacterium]
MPEKKKKNPKKKREEELEWETNELHVPEDASDYDEVVLNREEAEELLQKIQKLKKKLKATEEEKAEYLRGWQQARVEFAKLKKEEENVKKEASDRAKSGVLSEFFPVADSFDMAFSNQEAWNKVDENWRKGVEYIYAQLLSAFEREGMVPFRPLGEVFDPARHDSVEMVPVEDPKDDHTVVEVLQKGYTLNGKVVRPAKVKVGKFEGEN